MHYVVPLAPTITANQESGLMPIAVWVMDKSRNHDTYMHNMQHALLWLCISADIASDITNACLQLACDCDIKSRLVFVCKHAAWTRRGSTPVGWLGSGAPLAPGGRGDGGLKGLPDGYGRCLLPGRCQNCSFAVLTLAPAPHICL